MAGHHDAGGLCPVRDALSLYEQRAAVPVWLNGRGVPERDAQLYELPHDQLAHAAVFQHRSERDGGVPERADELSPAGCGAPQAAAADRERRCPGAPRVASLRHRRDADIRGVPD
ncbi:hypothetical protein L1887_42787 [Cichorium endivia]|nr:hypothetical protein L1887_42787 [Cichorium endivia]